MDLLNELNESKGEKNFERKKEKKDKRKMAEEKFFRLVSRYFVKYHVPNPLALPGAILAIWC